MASERRKKVGTKVALLNIDYGHLEYDGKTAAN
jgi:hypothetical protein